MLKNLLFFRTFQACTNPVNVWHDGVIYKLKCNGISGNLVSFFENYLQNRFQRVVLNETTSHWRTIKSGVPQGYVLGPLL